VIALFNQLSFLVLLQVGQIRSKEDFEWDNWSHQLLFLRNFGSRTFCSV